MAGMEPPFPDRRQASFRNAGAADGGPLFSIPVPPSRAGDVAELRLAVLERGVISDVLGRLGGHFARSSLSVAEQLKWDNTGTHAQRRALVISDRLF